MAYSPKRGPHAGETYRSYYDYRTTVLAQSQGYSSYADQQRVRQEAREAGVPVAQISEALRAKGASQVEALALQARIELRTGQGSAKQRFDRYSFYADELELMAPTVDHDDLFPDSP